MTDNTSDTSTNDGAIKDTSDWVTGDAPATPAQKSYLETMATQAGQTVDTDLNKAEASDKIEELQDEVNDEQQ